MDIHISRAEFNTILAALRYWQGNGMTDAANHSDLLKDIACPSGDDTFLDIAGIDALCERINFDEK